MNILMAGDIYQHILIYKREDWKTLGLDETSFFSMYFADTVTINKNAIKEKNVEAAY